MKATELRIGNYIGMDLQEHKENYFRVLEAAEESMKVTSDWNRAHVSSPDYFDADQMEGIPLSEEWLTRFGMFKYNNAWVFTDPTKRSYMSHEFEVFDHGDRLTYNSSEYAPELKHVHQLQNLYFALTGEELTLKQ